MDHDLSKDVRHIGVMECTHDHAEINRPGPAEENPEILDRLLELEDEKDKI